MPRNYETASGYGPIEFMDCGFITHVDNEPIDVPQIKSDGFYDGKVLQGYATKYREVLWQNGMYFVLMPGALDASLNDPHHEVRFQMDHDDQRVVGSTKTGLELYSDDKGLAFRFALPDSPLGREVKSLAQARAYTGMSIGFTFGKTRLVQVEGKTVKAVESAILHEISFLERGAVESAYAMLVDANRQPLREDCETKLVASDGAFIGVWRALQKLEKRAR